MIPEIDDLIIETKEDSSAKLAQAAGKPTKWFLFSDEFNSVVAFINNLKLHIILLYTALESYAIPSLNSVLHDGGSWSVFSHPVVDEQLNIDLAFNTGIGYRSGTQIISDSGTRSTTSSIMNGNILHDVGFTIDGKSFSIQHITSSISVTEGDYNPYRIYQIYDDVTADSGNIQFMTPTPRMGVDVLIKQPDKTISGDYVLATKDEIVDAINQLINGAPSDANTLKELNDKITAIVAIVGGTTADGDSIVNSVSELLQVFNTYPEGANVVDALAAKVNKTDIVNNLTQMVSGKVLDAVQGRILKEAIDALTTVVGTKANSSDLANYRPLLDTFNTISSLPDSLTLLQVNSWLRVNVSADGNLTVPNFATVPIPVGAYYYIRQSGTGKVTLVPGSGVTLNAPDNVLTTGVQYSVIKITKQSTDSWSVEVGSASYFMSKIKPLIDGKQNALGFVPFDATGDIQYRLKGYTLYHDFDKTATSGGYQMTSINAGTIVQASAYNDANHYGVLLVQSTNSANSGYYISQQAGSGGIANILMASLRTDFVFKTPTTIDSNSIIRFGFGTGALTTEYTYGTYIDISSNSLVGKTANNSVRSSTSAYTVSVDTWYHLRVEVTSLSLITYYVYDMSGSVLFSATLSTNIPAGITLDSRCVMINSGSVAKTIAYPDIITATIPPMQRGALN